MFTQRYTAHTLLFAWTSKKEKGQQGLVLINEKNTLLNKKQTKKKQKNNLFTGGLLLYR